MTAEKNASIRQVLLHTCCGPCSTFVAQWFQSEEFTVIGYFYNPNIQPHDEYLQRKLAAEKWAHAAGVELIIDTPYDPAAWVRAVGTNLEERCTQCYRLRLFLAATKARELGCVAFSTTLLISPYQQHDNIRLVGEEVATQSGVPFFYRDFRPDFRSTYALSRDLELYRQSYCGCILSDLERVERVARKAEKR